MTGPRQRCPTCKQVLPVLNKRQRICATCGLPVTAHHKWTFVIIDGKSTVVHRHCKSPESYVDESAHADKSV